MLINRANSFLIWVITALILYVIFKYTSIDLVIQKLFFDQTLNSFTLRNNFFIEKYLYHGSKVVAYIFGLASVIWLLHKIKINVDIQSKNIYVAALIATISIPLVITSLKHLTNIDCPWSFKEFGGALTYINPMNFFTDKLSRGQCFPAGHATGGFMWLSWSIIFWKHSPPLAKAMLLSGITMGLLMGVSRMAQGAHFLSHTLATVMIIWLISLISLSIAHRITK